MEENMHPDFLDEEEPMEPEKKQFSVKAFFKSTAFKCIYVLLAIVLICGVLLAFCNDLFYVSDEEKLDRVLGKIYPDGSVEEIIYNENNPTELETEFDNGAVVAAYKMDDGNYIINSYGTGGYKGKVYMWIVVEMKNGSIGGIGNIALDKTDGETYLDRLQPGEYEWFSDNYEDGENFVASDYTSNTLGTAASASMTRTAITNAVNTALEFVRTQLLGEVVGPDPFEKFSYTDYIDTAATTVELAEDGTSVIFHVVTTGYGMPGAFNIDITVNAEGVITDYTITKNGSTDDTYKGYMNEDILSGAMFENKSGAEILAMFKEPTGEDGQFVKNDLEDSTLASGASESTMDNAGYSNFLCVYAALFASNNYEVYAELIPLKLNQQMSEIYGESVVVEAVSLDGLTATVGNGTVNTVYSVKGTNNYIVSATGTGGFSDGNGTVTCWIVVETENGAVSGIKNVVIASHVGQSYIDMGHITDTTLGHFTDAFNGSDFAVSDWKDNNLTGGATMSTTAIVNSVNSAMNFVKANLLNGGAQE